MVKGKEEGGDEGRGRGRMEGWWIGGIRKGGKRRKRSEGVVTRGRGDWCGDATRVAGGPEPMGAQGDTGKAPLLASSYMHKGTMWEVC